MARELIRNINDARKAADLAITDRISASLSPRNLELAAVLAEHAEYIKSETLCDELGIGLPAPEAHTSDVDFEQGGVTIGIVKR